jgi:hypothetical protein
MPPIATQDPVNPNRSVVIEGKKFLWDGRHFQQQAEAASVADAYKNDNFEVQMVEVNGTYLIYTRRVVKEIAVTAPQ